MKKRRNEAQCLNLATRRPDCVIAPDGLIPNSVIRAKIKGLSNSPALPNRPSQAPVNQISLKTTSEDRKPTQQTPETTSSASTFYWESDPDDERIGPRTREIIEEDTPSGSTKPDVVQAIEDSGSYEFKTPGVLQLLTEETGTHEELESKPNWTEATHEEEEEESRNREGLEVDEGLNLENEWNDSHGHGVKNDLNLEKDVNADQCGFSCGSHSGYLPSTYSGVKEADHWRISHGEASGNFEVNGGYLQPDLTELSSAKVTMMEHTNGSGDVERSDTGSSTPSHVTLRNDDKEEEVDKLSCAIVGLDEAREGEEQWKWKTPSVLSIGLERVSPIDGKLVERPGVSLGGGQDNLDVSRHQLTYEVTKKKRQQQQPRLVSKAMVSSATGHTTTTQYHTIEIPPTDKWRGGKLLPNNPAMYRMYKKRDEMLNSVGRI